MSSAVLCLIRSLSGNQWFNQNLFTSPTLAPGQHVVTVTFTGDPDANAVPLTVDYFEVTTNPSDQHVGNNSTSNHGDPGTSSSRGKKTNVGAIVGGVIGAIALLALFGCAAWLFLRRRRRSRGVHEYKEKSNGSRVGIDRPSSGHIVPFPTSPRRSPTAMTYNDMSSSGALSPSSQGGLTSISAGLASSTEGYSTITGSESSAIRGFNSSRGLGGGKGNDRGAVAQRLLPDVAASSSSGHGISPTSSSQATGPTFVRHEDSGMRIAPEDAQGEVIDLPPDYTPS
jgi:hypothetical protein